MEDPHITTIIGMLHAIDDDGDNVTYSLANVTSGISFKKRLISNCHISLMLSL
jgi:hypothetical protein